MKRVLTTIAYCTLVFFCFFLSVKSCTPKKKGMPGEDISSGDQQPVLNALVQGGTEVFFISIRLNLSDSPDEITEEDKQNFEKRILETTSKPETLLLKIPKDQ